MIAWIRRLAALLAGLLLCGRFLALGEWIAAVIAVIVALAWSLDSFFPGRLRRPANSLLLVMDVLLVGWTAITGAFTWWTAPAVSLALICWNAGDFLGRWKDPPARSRARYLRSLALTVGVGFAASLSAALLGAAVSLGFALSFFLMLLGGFALLRTFQGNR
jgi:hypothetical protein